MKQTPRLLLLVAAFCLFFSGSTALAVGCDPFLLNVNSKEFLDEVARFHDEVQAIRQNPNASPATRFEIEAQWSALSERAAAAGIKLPESLPSENPIHSETNVNTVVTNRREESEHLSLKTRLKLDLGKDLEETRKFARFHLSNDGTLLTTVSDKSGSHIAPRSKIDFWDPTTGAWVDGFEHRHSTSEILLSGNNRYFIAGKIGIKVYERATKMLIRGDWENLNAVDFIDVHPTANVMAVLTSGYLNLYNLETGEKYARAQMSDAGLDGEARFSPDGKFIATTAHSIGKEGAAAIIETLLPPAARSKKIFRGRGPIAELNVLHRFTPDPVQHSATIEFSADSKLLFLSATEESRVIMVELNAGFARHEFSTGNLIHAKLKNSVNTKLELFATEQTDGLYLYSYKDPRKRWRLATTSHHRSFAFSPDGTLAAFSHRDPSDPYDQYVAIYDIASGLIVSKIPYSHAKVRVLDVNFTNAGDGLIVRTIFQNGPNTQPILVYEFKPDEVSP